MTIIVGHAPSLYYTGMSNRDRHQANRAAAVRGAKEKEAIQRAERIVRLSVWALVGLTALGLVSLLATL